MSNKIVVTGGAGFIGSHIVDACLDEGFEVHVIDNLSGGKTERLNDEAVFHKVDIRNLEAITPIIDSATYVFHTAALPRVQYSIDFPQETNENNVGGTVNVLIAAHEGGVKKVVYSASSSAYGDQEVMPLTETMPTDPKSPYGLQKLIGEQYCKVWSSVYGLPTVSLRYFNVYGSRLDPEGAYALVIGRFLKLRKEGLPLTITGDGTQTRDFTHVRDVVRANLLAARSESVQSGEVFNIGYGKRHSINTLASLIGGESEHVPPRLEPHDTEADNTRAKEHLSWEPTISLEAGVAELKKEWGFKKGIWYTATTMIVDGRAVAKEILNDVAKRTKAISFTPKLGVVTCAPGLETRQYLELKKRKAKEVGIDVIVLELPESVTTEDVIACVRRLAEECHGVLVQLPLPTHIDREGVLDVIPVDKDPDGFTYGRDVRAVLPPVVGAIDSIAKEHSVPFTNRKVVVVGNGRLVGQPASRYAEEHRAQVTVLTEDSEHYDELIAEADILVTGVGMPHFITGNMVKKEVVVFDAGASEDSGEVVGDVHPEVAKKAAVFTPVPGGIGPITVALLLRNVLDLLPNR